MDENDNGNLGIKRVFMLQLDVARKYVDHHTQAFGYKKPNIDFRKGYLEKLAEAGLQKNYYDMVMWVNSN